MSARDIPDARVITLTTTVTNGFLNIANGRHCLTPDAQGKPVLSACSLSKGDLQASVVTIIEFAGKCLTDTGSRVPSLMHCDYQNKEQQWEVLLQGGTEVRNTASSRCLAAAGRDNPVKMTPCNGSPEQYWQLP